VGDVSQIGLVPQAEYLGPSVGIYCRVSGLNLRVRLGVILPTIDERRFLFYAIG
jgi:hypothetical protein